MNVQNRVSDLLPHIVSTGVILLTYLRGPMTSLARGPSRPLHKWPPVKSAPTQEAASLSRHPRVMIHSQL